MFYHIVNAHMKRQKESVSMSSACLGVFSFRYRDFALSVLSGQISLLTAFSRGQGIYSRRGFSFNFAVFLSVSVRIPSASAFRPSVVFFHGQIWL